MIEPEHIEQEQPRPERKASLNQTRVAMVIISLLMIIFLIWSARSCGDDRYQTAMIAEERARQNYLDSLQRAEDSIATVNAVRAEMQARNEALQRAATLPPLGDSVVRSPTERIIVEKKTSLFVTFEGLNVRKGPGLNYPKIDRLPLFTEVEFLNEVTDSSFQINLGEITPDEPWIKIRTPKGQEGWVYGAGVDYYKKKLEGVIN